MLSPLIALVAASSAVLVAAQSGDSPYIPSSGISSQCSAFLEDLDSNPELAAASSRLLSATQLFDPSSTSSSSASSSQVKSALSTLCSAQSNACPQQLITRHLTWFSGNCSAELAANQPVVRSNYDILYLLCPFTQAVCTKDSSSGDYCASRISDEEAVEEQSSSSSSSTSSPTASSNSSAFGSSNSVSTTASNALFIQAPQIALTSLYMHISDATKSALSRLRKRQQQSPTSSSVPNTGAANSTTASSNTVTDDNALLPNATTFRTTNLPFLFLSGEMGQKQLCTDCTKNVLAAYVGFETDYPYGTGLSNSPILGAQASLWNDIGKVCGSGFLSAITAQSGNTISAAPRSVALLSGGGLALAGLVGMVFVL